MLDLRGQVKKKTVTSRNDRYSQSCSLWESRKISNRRTNGEIRREGDKMLRSKCAVPTWALLIVIALVGGFIGLRRIGADESGELAAKLKLQTQLRSPASRTRRQAILSLGERNDREALHMLIQNGLRDRAAEVVSASLDEIDRYGKDLALAERREAFGAEVIEPFRVEFQPRKRRSSDFSGRMARVMSRTPETSIYQELLQVVGELDDDGQAIWLAGVMAGFDDLADRVDERFLNVLPLVITQPVFSAHFGFRRAVYDVVGKFRQKDAVAFLIRQLETAQGELRYVLATHLQGLTHHGGGADAEAWKRWWTIEGERFEFPSMSATPEFRAEEATPSYYGLPVMADRLVFVLDTSKSMAIGAREPRIEIAKRELIRAIERLPPSTLFNIVVFNSTVAAWHETLAPASNEWKARAIEFVSRQQPFGRTITYDALVASMQLQGNLEAIYFLSDGAPSLGTIVQPEKIVEAIALQNRIRRMTIHTIGMFGGGAHDTRGLEAFMKRLAAENFGEFRRID